MGRIRRVLNRRAIRRLSIETRHFRVEFRIDLTGKIEFFFQRMEICRVLKMNFKI